MKFLKIHKSIESYLNPSKKYFLTRSIQAVKSEKIKRVNKKALQYIMFPMEKRNIGKRAFYFVKNHSRCLRGYNA